MKLFLVGIKKDGMYQGCMTVGNISKKNATKLVEEVLRQNDLLPEGTTFDVLFETENMAELIFKQISFAAEQICKLEEEDPFAKNFMNN